MKIAGLDLSISSSGIVIMELDDKFNVVNIERHGFVTTLKQQKLSPDMIYYNVKDYSCTYQRYQFFCDYILKWCKDCDVVAVEEYAMGKSGAQGLIFSLAEFEGNIKMSLFREGKKLRFYPPGTHKKFFTGKGNAGKIQHQTQRQRRVHLTGDLLHGASGAVVIQLPLQFQKQIPFYPFRNDLHFLAPLPKNHPSLCRIG